MASIREIRERMKSINDTMKITNAMYLISSSKLKKARKQLADVEPYFEKIQSTICDILQHTPEMRHAYFDERNELRHKKRGYIVVTADKGLSGAYNHNIIKLAEQYVGQHRDNALFVVGQVGRVYFARHKIEVDGEFLYTAQDPSIYRAREIAESMIDLFNRRYLDEVYILFTNMVSPVRLEPAVVKLLPLDKNMMGDEKRLDTKYEQFATYVPSPDAVLDRIVPNFIKGIIFGALVESFSSEQSARMTAMDAATKSAKDMIKELSLQFNRARQAAITQEISEIVGGADALRS